jgi:hypothetical protein
VIRVLLLALGLAGCGSQGPPVIRYQGVSTTDLIASDDNRNDLQIFVSFSDGDGDLGGGEVRIVDERTLSFPEPITIVQPIPLLTDRTVAISGTLVVNVANVQVIAQDGERATFQVTVADRAGRASNVVRTDPVVVHR